jgi:hypothetical protein
VTRTNEVGSVTTWETVGHIRKFSDRMLELLLKALRPEKYRERVDVNAHVGLSLEEIMQRGHERAQQRRLTEGEGG